MGKKKENDTVTNGITEEKKKMKMANVRSM